MDNESMQPNSATTVKIAFAIMLLILTACNSNNIINKSDGSMTDTTIESITSPEEIEATGNNSSGNNSSVTLTEDDIQFTEFLHQYRQMLENKDYEGMRRYNRQQSGYPDNKVWLDIRDLEPRWIGFPRDLEPNYELIFGYISHLLDVEVNAPYSMTTGFVTAEIKEADSATLQYIKDNQLINFMDQNKFYTYSEYFGKYDQYHHDLIFCRINPQYWNLIAVVDWN